MSGRNMSAVAAIVAAAVPATLPFFAGGDADAKKRRCHPSYKGACLKINAGDYDCIGGSGNGPNYTGRVRVVGPDVFGLDRDRDGIGCE